MVDTPMLLVFMLLASLCTASLVKLSPSSVGEDCGSKQQCAVHHQQRGTPGTVNLPTYTLAWAGQPATSVELLSVSNLRLKAETEARVNQTSWFETVSDIELLRFLRARNGHDDEAWRMLLDHSVWRNSQFGADSNFTHTFFENSPLHKEVFWMGLNKENCPTLVIRSQIHDGIYYNEDPHVFTSFLVSLLEQGKQLYGVGTERQMCVLLDRAGTVYRNGKKKVEKFDMGVIPNLLDLFRHMYSTFTHHYPDLLHYAKIAPASWFFSMCYKVTSRVMDARSRAKFQMLKESEIKDKLHAVFEPATLPPHLLGSSADYQSSIDVLFDPTSVVFPAREHKKSSWGKRAHTAAES